MFFGACYCVWQLAVLTSWVRTVRLSALFLAVGVGLYGAGTLSVFLQVLYSHAVVAVTGIPLEEAVRTASYTVDPLTEEIVKVLPLALLVLLHKRIRAQWGMTDYVLVGAATGAGFSLAEALLRFSGRVAEAEGGPFQGWTLSSGLTLINVPGLPDILTSWVPAPVDYESVFATGEGLDFNPHLLLSALAGLGVGLLIRGGWWLRLAGIGLIAYAWADHATHNYRVAQPEEVGFVGLLSGPMEILNRAEWLYPLLALGVAFYLDHRLLRTAKTVLPDVRPSVPLTRFALTRPPWSALAAGRFVLLRRNLYYATAAGADTTELHDLVRASRGQIEAASTAEAWRGVRLSQVRQRGSRGYLPLLVSAILALPALLYFLAGALPLTSGLPALLGSRVLAPVFLVISAAGLLWLTWQLVLTAWSLPRQRALPIADPVARADLRLLSGGGALVVGAASLFLTVTGSGLTEPLFSTAEHILEALGNATTMAGITLMLMALLLFLFPPGGLALAGAGALGAGAAMSPAALGALGAALGLGGMLMSQAGKNSDYWEEKYGDEADKWSKEPRRERISDGNKQELQDSGWLKEKVPDVNTRRNFMKWLEQGHKQGEAHEHLRPGSPEAEAALAEFLAGL